MTTITVQGYNDAPNNDGEVATGTRNRLRDFISTLKDFDAFTGLTKEQMQAEKAIGQECLHRMLHELQRQPCVFDSKAHQAAMQLVFRNYMNAEWDSNNEYSELAARITYRMEGMVQYIRKAMHQQGSQFTLDKAHWNSPWWTTSEEDYDAANYNQKRFGTLYHFGMPASKSTWNHGLPGCEYVTDGIEYERGMFIVYPHDGEPWVAGFLTGEDTEKLRFTRQRLGAVLAAKGTNDERTRSIVEKYKQRHTGTGFTVYPNDLLWQDVYTNLCRVGSCMTEDSDDYEGGTHPVNAYCSAAYGAGDNGLAIFYSNDGLSRGIINTHTMKCVRWYGDYSHWRALEAQGIEQCDGALKDSWLALIKTDDGDGFITPYVDCDYAEGDVNEDDQRVYLVRNGRYDLQTTEGYRSCEFEDGEEYVYCQYLDRRIPLADATELTGPGGYIHDDYVDGHTSEDVITGERWMDCDMQTIEYNGEYPCFVHCESSLMDSDCWCDHDDCWWSSEYEAVTTVDDEVWCEYVCVPLKNGGWIHASKYDAENDIEPEEQDEAA